MDQPRLTIEQAALALAAGQVIAYPTEAVWGLGCDPCNQQAVLALLALKQRPVEKGLILVAASLEQLLPWLDDLSEVQRQQLASPTAHPTTWLAPFKRDKVPSWIHGQHDFLAVRISAHPVVAELCRRFGGPVVSTSANPQALPTATSHSQLREYFSQSLAVCDGDLGVADRPSTIRNLLTGQLIRE